MTENNGKPYSFQKQNISETLIGYIKNQILSGELNPGDRIVETKLAKELGISQTPVREALRNLQGEGIITIVPNRGPSVTSLDRKDVFEIYSVRSVLEGLAIRLATQNASASDIAELESIHNRMKDKMDDDSVPYLLQDSLEIHETIIKLSNHSRILKMYKSISFQVALINRNLGTKSSKRKEVEQHWELVEALKYGDPEQAENRMRRHIYRSYCDFMDLNEEKTKPVEYNENAWF